MKSSLNAAAERITKTNDDVKTRMSSSAHSNGSYSSTSSRTSVKSKRAALMARLQAQAEINALEEQQAKRRFDYKKTSTIISSPKRTRAQVSTPTLGSQTSRAIK